MLRKSSYHLLLISRWATTCAHPLQPSLSSSAALIDHWSHCLKLIAGLLGRGREDLARKAIIGLIDGGSTTSGAVPPVDCESGFVLMKKLMEMGVRPDSPILDSVVCRLVKLGKFERGHLDRILESGYIPSDSTSSLILEMLFEKDQFLEAFDYFVQFGELGATLPLWCFKELFKGLCCRGHLDEAMTLKLLMERTGTTLPLNLYKSLFYGLCRNGCAPKAEELLCQMEDDGYFVDKVMYTCLMKAYQEDNNMTMAMRVYLRMLKKGCELDHHIFNTLIHGFAKVGQLDKGRIILNQMMEKGFQPNAFTYHLMISWYCRERNADCDYAMLLENMMVKDEAPNVHYYTSLIAALLKKNQRVRAGKLYMKLLENGVPDHVLFSVFLKMYPKGGELELALMNLQAIVRNGCGIDPLANLKDLRDIDSKIGSLLKTIAGRDKNLAASGLAIVTAAFCARGDSSSATGYVDMMMDLGCRPLLFSYNSMVKSLCQDELFKVSESSINLMQERGIVPDHNFYLIMVDEYCKRGDFDSAFDYMAKMEKTGLRPTVAIYSSIIGSLGRQGRVSEAENAFVRMVESGIKPDEVAYTALISGFLNSNMTEKACLYLDRMLQDGFTLNRELYTLLISHFFKAGDYESSLRLVILVVENHIRWDLITYITILSGLCRAISGRKRSVATSSESEKAKERLLQRLGWNPIPHKSIFTRPFMINLALCLIEEVKDKIHVPKLHLYNAIISVYCEVGKMGEASRYLDSMQREGILTNQVTSTILMKAHIKAHQIDSAIAMFNQMSSSICMLDEAAYIILLRGLCDACRPLDALILAYTMKKRGLTPDRISYDKLLRCVCASRLTAPALEIFKDMLVLNMRPRPYSQNALLRVLFDEKKFEEACSVYDALLQRGMAPSTFAKRVFSEEKKFQFTLTE